MHLQSQNYVEAALTLKLHSDLYEWDLNSFLEPMPDLGLPRQSQFARKETLSLLILDYLGEIYVPGSITSHFALFAPREGEGMGKSRRNMQGAGAAAL